VNNSAANLSASKAGHSGEGGVSCLLSTGDGVSSSPRETGGDGVSSSLLARRHRELAEFFSGAWAGIEHTHTHTNTHTARGETSTCHDTGGDKHVDANI